MMSQNVSIKRRKNVVVKYYEKNDRNVLPASRPVDGVEKRQ